MSDDPLLQPFELRHLTVRNRVFSSAHEPAYSEDGLPKDRYREYHVEKAKGGIGMTMTAGSAVVAEDSPPAFGNLHAYDDAIVPWIRRMTDAVHEHGTACMIQLTHLGRRTGWGQDDWLPIVAPSPLREPAHRGIPKEAEDWDIERIVAKYACRRSAMQAGGMDGIEIEAYGHLFDQFWSPLTNRRDDEYGGSFERRLRFGWEVFEAIRASVGPDFLVGIRMAIDETVAGGIDAPTGLDILGRLESDGLIDFVNVIRGHIATESGLTEVIPIHGMRSAPHLDFCGQVRAATRSGGAPRGEDRRRRHRTPCDRRGQGRPRRDDPGTPRRPTHRAEDRRGPRGGDPAVRGSDVLPRSHLRSRRGAVHPQRGDESRSRPCPTSCPGRRSAGGWW